MKVVPLGVVESLLAITQRGLENDVYFQGVLLTIIGLSSKNAILIMEFSEERYRQGQILIAVAGHAAAMRLQPILMTSLGFAAGVLPLAVSTGVGANSRIAIGTGIIGGIIIATLLAIFLRAAVFLSSSGIFSQAFHNEIALSNPPMRKQGA